MQYLTRHLEEQIKTSANLFKAVLLLGPRQVGKNTLLTHLYPEIKMVVFDPIQDIYKAREDPDLFLESFPPPLILDEVQYVPELLPALKRKMDQNPAKGQYFLTSSQNFSVLKSVAESMAGRVAIFHLEHLTLLEVLNQGNQKGWLSNYLENSEKFPQQQKQAPSSFYPLVQFLFRGTFPATIDFPTEQVPIYFRSYLQTYIDRDVRLQEDIRNLAEFDRFLGIVASLTAQEINASHLGREIGVSPNTARRWLDLLTYTYQWMEIPPYHGNTIKRISGKKKGVFKDVGFASYLQKINSSEALAINPKLGALFETWAINHIHQMCSALSVPPNLYHWRTSAGAEVDLILERDGKLYPIEIKCKTQLTKKDLTGIRAFEATYPHSQIMPALIIYAGKEVFKVDETTWAIPWNLL